MSRLTDCALHGLQPLDCVAAHLIQHGGWSERRAFDVEIDIGKHVGGGAETPS